MALYRYVKQQNRRSFLSRIPNIREKKNRMSRKFLTLFSIGFFGVGLFLLGQVAYPVAGWYLFVLPGYTNQIVSPLSTQFENQTKVLSANSTINDAGYDVNKWFVGAPDGNLSVGQAGVKTYNLSIPKLSIDSAIVKVGTMDLKKSLIGWPTSPLPGQFGNNIIFGHSELPQFANTTNYAGIFTHLMELGMGDEILVDYDGVRYRYEVIDKIVVKPTDLSVLEQRFDSAYITLITCVPPGTIWQRGVIRGKLVEI